MPRRGRSQRRSSSTTKPGRARYDRVASEKKMLRQVKAPPVALTIAGSDCSAGAGIQADLKTFSAFGVYGLSAVTCIVAEVPRKVSRIEPVSAAMVREQIDVLLKSYRVGAIKTGLLCSAEIVCAVVKALHHAKTKSTQSIPLIVDPVMIATSGDQLLVPEAIHAYKNKLFPIATLITPNLDEAAALLETTIADRKQMEKTAKALANKYRVSVLLKGGHLRGNMAVDLLFHDGKLTQFAAPFAHDVHTHGTGCTYSAAIAAGLAFGLSLEQAVEHGKTFVTKSINQHFRWKSKSRDVLDALRHGTWSSKGPTAAAIAI